MTTPAQQSYSSGELRVVVMEDPPFSSLERQENGTFSCSGYLIELWQMLATHLNLRFTVVPFFGRSFETMSSNGTWGGMLGELAHGRADVVLSWYELRSDRQTIVDYIDEVPVIEDHFAFYTRQMSAGFDQTTLGILGSILGSVELSAWLLLLVFLLALSATLRMTLVLGRGEGEEPTALRQMTWGWCLLSSYRALTSQGWSKIPPSFSARIVTVSVWVLGILFHCIFTAELASHLTITTEVRPINSLMEVHERSSWIIAAPPYLPFAALRKSDDFYVQDIRRRILERDRSVILQPSSESYSVTLEPNVLSWSSRRELRYFLGSQGCGFVQVPDSPFYTGPGFIVVAKNRRALRSELAGALMKLSEAGLVAQLKRRWMYGPHQDCDGVAEETVSAPLTMAEVLPVLLLVPAGVLCGVLALLLELCLFHRMAARSLRMLLWFKSSRYRPGPVTSVPAKEKYQPEWTIPSPSLHTFSGHV